MAERVPNVGISNRETPEEEARERESSIHQLWKAKRPSRSGRSRKQPTCQTSTKSGTKASAQKEQSTRHTERTAPSAAKVQGAFGKESD